MKDNESGFSEVTQLTLVLEGLDLLDDDTLFRVVQSSIYKHSEKIQFAETNGYRGFMSR